MEANAHVLAIPFPLQGHLNPMLQLCNLLVSKGIRVTLLVTSLVNVPSQGKLNQIEIETIPDVELTPEENSDIIELFFKSYKASITGSFKRIVDKYRDTDLKAVIYDSVSPWILDLVHGEGIKGAVLFTQPCAVSAVYYHVYNRSLETPVNGATVVRLPSLPELRGGDLPSFVYDTTSFPVLVKSQVEQFYTFWEADWRLFNTFTEFEDEIIQWLSSRGRIQVIGPTVPCPYTNKPSQGNCGLNIAHIKSSFDESCIEWLDQKRDNSVVYVSFGTLSQLSEKQIEEVARGLTLSGVTFLWAARDSEQVKFPPDFKPDKERGMIVNWCSQIRVLAHPAVACFVTHGGWNSILEAVCSGVPMLVLPQWADQTMNAKLIADFWGIGVRGNGDIMNAVEGDQVAALIGEVLRGDQAAEIRKNAHRWKKVALEAVAQGGSSYVNLDDFVDGLLNS